MNYKTYQSPFTWRYGSREMRAIWSEKHKRRLWRRIWVALAQAESELGLVTPAQVADLEAHADQVDVARALEIEVEIHHDLMAEIRVFAGQCPLGGGIIHLGATSADIEDNADALRLRESCDLVLAQLRQLLGSLARQVHRWAELPIIAFTHLQPAEPTTVGYRLAQYAQDLLVDVEELERVRARIRGKGFKGAVGTSASYGELLSLAAQPTVHGDKEPGATEGRAPTVWPSPHPPASAIEDRAMAILDLEAWRVTTQVYPRKQDWLVLNALAGLAASLHKFAFDLRVLQSPAIGEWAEPFGQHQVGSSAMPFKRNPVSAEKMDSLARYLAQLPRVAWDNAANSLLERTLDDSANRRVVLPEAFLCADELLRTARRLVDGLRVDEKAAARNLAAYGVFAATERLLMAAVAAGADRQAMHETIRQHSLVAWGQVAAGHPNPLPDDLAADEQITRYLPAGRVLELLDASAYVGDAPERARALAAALLTRAGIGGTS